MTTLRIISLQILTGYQRDPKQAMILVLSGKMTTTKNIVNKAAALKIIIHEKNSTVCNSGMRRQHQSAEKMKRN